MSTVIPMAFAVSLFCSPDFLTIFGNGLVNGGVYFLGFFIIVFIFHFFTAKSCDYIYSLHSGLNNEYLLISRTLGNIAGFIFPFFNKAAMAVCMGVGILATAGYAFNELFARWFPNMGFTLAALGLLLIIGLTGQRVARVFQVVFSGVTFSGMIILSITGLFSSAWSLPVAENIPSIEMQDMTFFMACFIMLMGFEMSKFHEEKPLQGKLFFGKISMAALLSGFLLLFTWGLVTLMSVSPERISDISIPHLITARAINVNYGREIMGLVIVFGSMAAVNALLSYVSSIAGEVMSKELSLKINKLKYRTYSLFILVLIIAGLLISGMAGEPEFETFVRGSIYLWFLAYGAIHLALFLYSAKSLKEGDKSISSKYYFNLAASLFIIGLYCGLVLTDHETVLILIFTGITIGAALFLYLTFKGIIAKNILLKDKKEE